MNKLVKSVAVVALSAVAAVGVGAVAGCGESSSAVAGTYTVTYGKSDLLGNIRHSGYITNGDCKEVNTLVLKEDKTYEYTKFITTDVNAASPAVASYTPAYRGIVIASAEETDANILFSWTAAGTCTLDFYKNGQYKFVLPSMNVSEVGTWTWSSWTMKVKTPKNKEYTATMDDATHALKLHYVSDMSERLYEDFTCEASVWGAKLGQTGAYTPVEGEGPGSGETPDEPEKPTYSGPVKIKYKFTGTYTYEGQKVTLSAATGCTWSEDWGSFQNHGFTNVNGTEKDLVYPKGATGMAYHPLNHFGGKYYFAGDGTDVTNNNSFSVTLKDGGSFEYVEQSAFD